MYIGTFACTEVCATMWIPAPGGQKKALDLRNWSYRWL